MTVAEYYEQAPAAAKDQLQKLRQLILGELEQPEEVISYQIPHFVCQGKRVVAIGGFRQHVSLFPYGAKFIKKYAKELSGYKTSAGTIQFPLARELPEDLIKKIVKDRLAELLNET